MFIERVMKDREDVTDLAQDVFLKVFERWKEFETEENAKAFLYISARNLCFDRLRRKQAEDNYQSQYSREEESNSSTLFAGSDASRDLPYPLFCHRSVAGTGKDK